MTAITTIENKPEKTRERGIDRVLKLLAYLNERGNPVRVAELPKALGAPRSTIYELVRVLTESGVLELSGDDNKVYFGKLIYLYGINYLRENDLVRRGSAEVDALSKLTGETSELCMLHRNRQAIVHSHSGSRPLRISSEVGGQIPLPWTASGRLLLAQMTSSEIEALLSPEDMILPNKKLVAVADFVADCIGARGSDIVASTGLISSFTQCLASPIRGLMGKFLPPFVWCCRWMFMATGWRS
ncbi:IclR family transcriptional regulator [Devosia rhodophyticola]|uniref:IclR family transcriptional regulator n=1 Tax=Devosia rhodophyticola TaxID=3026423 RepID=A0ABY7Z1I2_9HYPH|nr:IclR family transcriptional regulator [Devosia rhodophyticola]WDR07439.1 IclR family transcriptional regulator [Devosia rhodophyticola]